MRCEYSTSTLVDLLVHQTSEQDTRPAYVFLDDRGEASQITYAQLDERARAIAARLQSQFAPGDRALLVYPAGLEFITAFCGCLYAGVVPVPATYPKPKRPMPRLNRIALDCTARVALSTAPTLATLDPEVLSADAATNQWIATDEIDDRWAGKWRLPQIAETDIAFLQYTSGSTSDPKGVMVSHANLLNNLECIRQAFGIAEVEYHADATGVFWLPAYHDMGLIGGILTPLYMGGRSVLMSPTSFLQRPLRWLEAIDEYQASISGAPNFAYEYCVRRTTAEGRAELDLSHWRLAFCGAEPIRAETLGHFADAFGPAGFRADAFYPCYGLAETTLLAAGPDYRNEPRVLAVNRAALADHRVVPAAATEPAELTQRLVSCGQAMSEHEIAIVDPLAGTPCRSGSVGEILIQGPSVAQGYWNRPEETEQTFGATVAGQSGRFLRTGDLGFFRDGDLFVTGRLKDVIIIRGRNHYPQDIEQTAEQAHPAVLPGAAFALTENDEEQLVVVHQLDRQYRDADHDAIVRAIRRSIVEGHELDPYAIVLIRQTSLPITSSGKVQRTLCREQYQAGQLKVVHAWTNTVATASPSKGKNGHWRGLSNEDRGATVGHPASHNAQCNGANGLDVDRAAERIETWLLEWLVERLQLSAADVQRDRPFAEFGVDSIAAVELSHELEEQFDVPLPPIVAWNYPTPAALARYLAEQKAGAEQRAGAEQKAGAAQPAGVASAAVDAPQQASGNRGNRSANGLSAPAGPSPDAPVADTQLAALLAEIESLSDEEAARLLAEGE
jgi:acyl-CoA synthetase (AMP-forming)/AMP-acid ligase II/acyl carrier protein